jgi:hypothetical protein
MSSSLPPSQPYPRIKLLQDTITELESVEKKGYGSGTGGIRLIADLWTTYLQSKFVWIEIDPSDVSTMMILLKISRIVGSPDKEDHWKDICGYAALGHQTRVEDVRKSDSS